MRRLYCILSYVIFATVGNKSGVNLIELFCMQMQKEEKLERELERRNQSRLVSTATGGSGR